MCSACTHGQCPVTNLHDSTITTIAYCPPTKVNDIARVRPMKVKSAQIIVTRSWTCKCTKLAQRCAVSRITSICPWPVVREHVAQCCRLVSLLPLYGRVWGQGLLRGWCRKPLKKRAHPKKCRFDWSGPVLLLSNSRRQPHKGWGGE